MEYIMSLLEDNDKLKLAKAVFNHTKTVANDYIDKYAKSTTYVNGIDINEDQFYEIAMIEIEEDNKVKSTWAKALIQANGEKEKLEPTYIKLRVAELLQEEKENIIIYQELERIRKIKEEENRQLMLQEDLKQQKLREEENEKIKIKEWLEKDEKLRIEYEKNVSERNNKEKLYIYIIVIFIISISILLILK
jgi:hypothetical protein